ncbi:11525_t:CDS:1, partial [Diversispora eburnea]
ISSSDTITEARRYARFYELGGECLEKPIYKRNRISQEELDQLQRFLNDKNNIIMSSYKTDAKTGLPVKYLKDTKEALWEKFSQQLPNGVKCLTFLTFMKGKQYIY